MAQATKKSRQEGIAVEEIVALQARVVAGQLQAEDLSRLNKLLELLLALLRMIEHPKLKLRQLRRKLFGKPDEPPPPSAPSAPTTEMASAEATVEVTQPAVEKEKEVTAEKPTQKRKGHGRRAAATLAGAEVVPCLHVELQPGGACPLTGCAGKLYDLQDPHKFVQWVGHPPLTATRYEQQMLRCSACLERFEAPLPEGVTPQKYDATADVALVLNKYGQMTPWTRQAEVQELCGLPLAEATQWERCECVADALLPVKLEMERQAAQAELVGADDTGVKILSHLQAQKSVPAKERRATHTTGLVASNTTGNITSKIIVLFESGAHHAGEVIGRLFKLRQAEAGQPIQQGDGSASNWSHDAEVIAAKCWAHAGRPFEELKKNFPAAASFVQSSIAEIYRTERKASDLKLSAAERLLLHQQESGMVLLRFKAWLAQQWEEKLVEPNSACGQALRYLENHWQELTEFLRTPGIPLDNNAVERALRRPALLRRNALFFKTEHGAAIGSLLLGILETCKVNGVNAWEYLLAVYRNARAVREKPFDWTPWRWADLQTPPAG